MRACVLALATGCAAPSAPLAPTHPANPGAPVGQLEAPPASLAPGVVDYGIAPAAPPEHHDHSQHGGAAEPATTGEQDHANHGAQPAAHDHAQHTAPPAVHDHAQHAPKPAEPSKPAAHDGAAPSKPAVHDHAQHNTKPAEPSKPAGGDHSHHQHH